MSWARPSHIDSEWYEYDEDGNGRLRDEAPPHVVDEFNRYVESHIEETYGPQQPEARVLVDGDMRDDDSTSPFIGG